MKWLNEWMKNTSRTHFNLRAIFAFWGPHDNGGQGQRVRWVERSMWILSLYSMLISAHSCTVLAILRPERARGIIRVLLAKQKHLRRVQREDDKRCGLGGGYRLERVWGARQIVPEGYISPRPEVLRAWFKSIQIYFVVLLVVVSI